MFSDARVVGATILASAGIADVVVGIAERRALMSAPDAPTGWDLRCAVREELLNEVNRRHGESLPRTRVVLQHTNGERA